MKKSIALFLVLTFSQCVNAESMGVDGNHLLNQCKHYINFLDTGDTEKIKEHPYSVPYCQGFIDSSREVVSQMRIFVDDDRFKACIPIEIPNDQIARVVVSYLKQKPDLLHKSAGLISMMALINAYPCAKKQ